ncbi:MAG TPA: sigma-70 family RNA polymerase sigma factor [Thermoanaerobaculia bacterium]|jgi:RNA polymerase sigma-70 factor (ECF subfamily)
MELFVFDDDYVRRLREGDRWTEEHFVSYFRPLLVQKLRFRLRSADDIKDYCQDVFIRVYASIRKGDLQDGRKLGAFVHAVCKNLILERARTAKRTEPLDENYDAEAPGESAEQTLVTEERKAFVRQVIERMPSRDAAILRGLFLEDRDKDELCRELGVDRAYLRVVLHRAKERFRTEYLGDVTSFPRGPETKTGLPSLLL